MPNLLSYDIRRMLPTDVDAVMQVELTAYAQPWTPEIFRDCLKVGYQSYLVSEDNCILGYAVMSFGAGEAHILNLCVAPERQRQGIGRYILRYLLDVAAERNVDTLFLEVRVSNIGANHLYQSEGFNEIGRRRDYYPARNGREDALVFARSLL